LQKGIHMEHMVFWFAEKNLETLAIWKEEIKRQTGCCEVLLYRGGGKKSARKKLRGE